MSAAFTPGPVRVEIGARSFRVHLLPASGVADRVEQSVVVHRQGGTGFAWRNVPLRSHLARAAIAKALPVTTKDAEVSNG
jgi:hypothetical protein